MFWLQLYRFWHDDHKIGFDLVRRAQAVDAKVLVLTLDVPVRTTRSRETYAGLAHEFRPNARMIYEMMVRPRWLLALLRNGYPRFATISDYARPGAGTNEIIAYARARMGGAFSWEEVKRYRDAWKGPMAVKGVLHPEDADKAVALGIEGIWVSNHGGRQIEALTPSIDVLPAIVAAVGKKATILLDSGIRSGQDVMRALALGAERGLCRQVVPLGGGCARRRRAGLSDRPLYRRAARVPRPDRRPIDWRKRGRPAFVIPALSSFAANGPRSDVQALGRRASGQRPKSRSQ